MSRLVGSGTGLLLYVSEAGAVHLLEHAVQVLIPAVDIKPSLARNAPGNCETWFGIIAEKYGCTYLLNIG